MRYGFIGAGNMASAIIKGLYEVGKSKYVYAYNTTTAKTEALKEKYGINICHCQEEVVENSGIVILAVKPGVIGGVIEKLKYQTSENTQRLIISIAAGKDIKYIESILGQNTPIARFMPNINAKVLMSCTGYCFNNAVSDEQKKEAIEIFKSIGEVYEVEEKSFDIFSTLAGSTPAFAYMYIDALARAAVKAGMPKSQALKLSAQTALGSAKLILESQEHPWELIDQVCSPGGTTIEGIAELQSRGFEAALSKSFDCVYNKNKML